MQKYCTFCFVPDTRRRFHAVEDVLTEVAELAQPRESRSHALGQN